MGKALTPHRGALRAVRGTALAVTAVLLAVVAHVGGGGSAPDGVLTVLLTLAVAAAGTVLADRQRGPVSLLAAVGATQLLLHLLLDGTAAHAHDPQPVTVDLPAMTAAHAVAAVVTALLLAGAESALFTVAAAWRRIVVVAPFRPVPPLGAHRTPVVPSDVPVLVRVLLAGLPHRRGPPVHS